MGFSSSKLWSRNSVEAVEVKEFNTGDDDAAKSGSESLIATDRKKTDILFLILLVAVLIILFILDVYCLAYGDLYRIINGYDDCGNVCGKDNKKVDYVQCSGVDRTYERYLRVVTSSPYGGFSRSCVRNCDNGYRTFINRCLPLTLNRSTPTIPVKASFFSKTGITEFFQEVSEDLQTCWAEILYLMAIALIISVIVIVALKHISGVFVWLVLIGIDVALLCGTIYLWIEFASTKEDHTDELFDNATSSNRKQAFLAFAIIVTIIFVAVTLIIIFLRNRIRLIVQLFIEAGKVLIDIPSLILIPFLTCIALATFILLFILLAIVIESSGRLQLLYNLSAKYVKDPAMLLARWYNFFVLLWIINFIIGCQHMVVSGTVSTWFFSRNKSALNQPIKTSFKNLVHYHLGTVALGSLLIAVLSFIRYIIDFVTSAFREPTNKFLESLGTACQCCLGIFDGFLKYITKNAYIETAIAGTSFCESGRRAFYILSNNALRVIAINSIGDFVLFLSKLFVVSITVLIGIEVIQKKNGVYHAWVVLTLIGIFSYCIANSFISLYEMIIDSIFICFCEDFEHNDGINKPYFMPRSLMEFIQNSKKSQSKRTSDVKE